MELEIFFRDVVGVRNERTAGMLAAHANVRHVAKKEKILNQGEISKEVFFLMSGGAKYYSVDQEDHVNIDFFALRVGYPVMPISLVEDRPSKFYIETLVESAIVYLPWKIFNEALETDDDFSRMYNQWISVYISKQKELVRSYYRNSTDRYEHFLSLYPQIVQMASQKDIACFLNMTPERLCNIKRELKQKADSKES